MYYYGVFEWRKIILIFMNNIMTDMQPGWMMVFTKCFECTF